MAELSHDGNIRRRRQRRRVDSSCLTARKRFCYLPLYYLLINKDVTILSSSYAFQFGGNAVNKNDLKLNFYVDSAHRPPHQSLKNNEGNSSKYCAVTSSQQCGQCGFIHPTESPTPLSYRTVKWQFDVPQWAMKPPLLRPCMFGEHNLEQPFYFASHINSSDVQLQFTSNCPPTLRSDRFAIRKDQKSSSPSSGLGMPPWLGHQLDPCIEQRDYITKLNALESAMGLYRSRSEVAMVIATISKAFPLRNEISQRMLCVNFLSLLVEFMEVSHVALCASIWHFRTCFHARMNMLSPSSEEHLSPVSPGPWSSTLQSDQKNSYVSRLRAMYATYIPLEAKKAGDEDKDEFSMLASRVMSGAIGEELQIKTIARQASKLKVHEMMAEMILSRPPSSSKNSPVIPFLSLDATSVEHVQSLLLSVNANGDWNALAIRTAACLFRLKGLRQFSEVEKEVLWTRNEARKALYIFAPLAHRMGMFKLKEELEREGFRLLYKRQYDSVMCLYEGKKYGCNRHKSDLSSSDINSRATQHDIAKSQDMKTLLSDVTSRVKRVLQEDHAFMDLIASVSVTARIKEPYSLWKKIVRVGKHTSHESKDLTIFDVPDALAIRVVLRARKLLEDEDDSMTKARERELCYYVKQLCEDKLLSKERGGGVRSKHKDYIQNPKPNGYQSIHFRFQMRWRRKDWPFEVQIRSFDMHRIAEYGLAAHWVYKMQSISSDQSKFHRGKPADGYLKSVEAWKKGELLRHHIHAVGSNASPLHGSIRNDIERTVMGNLERYAREDRKREQQERLAPYLEALSILGSDLAREQVIVFLSTTKNDMINQGGTTIALPAGARVLDAMREGEKKLSTKLSWLNNHAVCKNGVVVSLTERLHSGDILTVDTKDINDIKAKTEDCQRTM